MRIECAVSTLTGRYLIQLALQVAFEALLLFRCHRDRLDYVGRKRVVALRAELVGGALLFKVVEEQRPVLALARLAVRRFVTCGTRDESIAWKHETRIKREKGLRFIVESSSSSPSLLITIVPRFSVMSSSSTMPRPSRPCGTRVPVSCSIIVPSPALLPINVPSFRSCGTSVLSLTEFLIVPLSASSSSFRLVNT